MKINGFRTDTKLGKGYYGKVWREHHMTSAYLKNCVALPSAATMARSSS